MNSIQIEGMPQLIEARQRYLRSLAGHGQHELAPEPFRRRAGHLLVRFGRWVEGRRPEPQEVFPSLATSRPTLAGRAR